MFLLNIGRIKENSYVCTQKWWKTKTTSPSQNRINPPSPPDPHSASVPVPSLCKKHQFFPVAANLRLRRRRSFLAGVWTNLATGGGGIGPYRPAETRVCASQP